MNERDEVRVELRILAACRLAIRASLGTRLGVMTPSEMVDWFVSDPRDALLKVEGHGPRKAKDKRWRIIWVSSLIDSVCQGLLSYSQNKADIAAFQSGKPTCHAMGCGHSDSGIHQLVEAVHAATQGGPPIKLQSSDASGFDFSITRRAMLTDGMRRVDLFQTDSGDVRAAMLHLMMCEEMANSAHVVAIHGSLWECLHFGSTASGIPNTTSQNTWVRAFVLFIAGAILVWTLGGDEIHFGEVCAATLLEWGIVIKPGSQKDGHSGDFEMLSHNYLRDSFGSSAIFLNIEKLVGTVLLNHANKKPLTPAQASGHLHVLRSSEAQLTEYLRVAEWLGYDPEEMVAGVMPDYTVGDEEQDSQ